MFLWRWFKAWLNRRAIRQSIKHINRKLMAHRKEVMTSLVICLVVVV